VQLKMRAVITAHIKRRFVSKPTDAEWSAIVDSLPAFAKGTTLKKFTFSAVYTMDEASFNAICDMVTDLHACFVDAIHSTVEDAAQLKA
jgi:hypothetical protein